MAGVGTGQILGQVAVDTLSANPTGTFPPKSVSFEMKKLNTIKYNFADSSETMEIVDVTKGTPYESVNGIPFPPLTSTIPPQLPRPVVVPIQNTTVFMEGTLVTVDGDAVAGPGALPDPRILHGSGSYANIIIGTNVV